jgi:hypothetical protein
MEQRLTQLICGLLSAAVIWGFSTINELQLQVNTMETGHIEAEDFNDLRRSVDRLTLLLELQAAEK